MKHVSNATWERLKQESALHLYGELHHLTHESTAAVSDPETAPIAVQLPGDS
ncbi:hypothetical protein [Cryobacterium luteum]|uniref:hypothetical protein n=1 Tax=Cryobacterium luteum TaxID=1424661 RepID=UPI0008D47365|nr:hypothetical protein [Cryobacterium luteum]SEN37938.1 hypothetical protein SAMN05216281_1074 [Cryobacterium luteum]